MADSLAAMRRLPSAPAADDDSAKRRQIIDGARAVFLAQGFDAASMGEIAREAGVSKGTLYVYFKSKEELFEAIVEERVPAQAEQIFAFDRAGGHRSELTRLGIDFARFLCRPGGVSALRTVIAIADRMPELGAQVLSRPARRAASRSLQAYLEAKVAAGVLEPTTARSRPRSSSTPACRRCSSRCCSTSGPPTDERIAHVVGIAVRTFLAAYRTPSRR